ncbi:hypothetical protein HF325_002390 [Metschnikowia pulcherrima]|uniref:Peptidase M3A/M3B catalytic domain-containing protein n=1 Tax=Metschnikowia pulcherrima TaxID=27326 RepID=A0A8H7GU25_9ASCO|nr:hypothetical protein HF325_002390 [Metschnikowia pulcherrima]
MLLIFFFIVVSIAKFSERASTFEKALNFSLTPHQILQEAKDIVVEENKFLESIANIEEPTVANVLIPTIEFENRNEKRETMLNFYKMMSPSKEVREASADAEQIVAAELDLHLLQRVFAVYVRLWEKIKDDPKATNAESRKFLKSAISEYRKYGFDLPKDEKEMVRELQEILSELTQQFATNIGEEDEYVVFSQTELDGVPEKAFEQYNNFEQDEEIFYNVSLAYTSILPILRYGKNQDVRKRAYVANMNRARSNDRVLDEIVRIRFRLAKLLGFKSYSEYVLEDCIAQSSHNVVTFLKQLKEKLHPLAKKEVQIMLKLKNQELAANGEAMQSDFYAWDDEYYHNLLLEKEYNVDHQLILEYFPLQQTLSRMLLFYENLFDVKFVMEDTSAPDTVWHEDVSKYAVYQNVEFGEPSDKFMGWIFFDLHERDGKFSNAAAFRLHTAYEKPDGSRSPGYTAVVCNFPQAAKNSSDLLQHGDVVTLLHELGHGLHQLLSQTKHARFQGTFVPKDFVECPSQMLEFWAWSENELKCLLGHYQTGEPIPKKLVENLIQAKYVNTGLMNLRQLLYSEFDMALHTIESEKQLSDLDIKKLWNRIFDEPKLVSSGETENIGYATFGHIVWGYESGYYGYLYSKVFAADIYHTHFKADPMNVEKGLTYRDIILKNGGAREIPEILEELLGRAPNSDAFLKEILGGSKAESIRGKFQ